MAEQKSHVEKGAALAQVQPEGEHHAAERSGNRGRKILVFAHVGRKEARDAARQACAQLYKAGLTPVMTRSDLETLSENWDEPVPVQVVHESILSLAWCWAATARFCVPPRWCAEPVFP